MHKRHKRKFVIPASSAANLCLMLTTFFIFVLSVPFVANPCLMPAFFFAPSVPSVANT